jgi:hypothetical protein
VGSAMMDRIQYGTWRGPAILVIGIAATVMIVAAFSILPQTSTYDTWGALFVGPFLFALSLPILAREARRERDRRLFWLLLIALLAKLLGALARDWVASEVYGGVTDATRYHEEGIRLSELFRSGIFTTGLEQFTGTDFIYRFTGILYTILGPTRLGGSLIYSWLAFWGLFLFYRAFVTAVPEGRSHSYAKLLFFLPSILFWPSGIGKDAWMIFALGIAALGAARLLRDRTWNGIFLAGLGLTLAGLVRFHVAGMLALALAVAYFLRRPSETHRRRSRVARTLALVAVAVLAVILVLQAEKFLQGAGIDPDQGIASALQEVSRRTGHGGSEIQPSVLRSPSRVPLSIITVLFRPLPMEADSSQTLVAALESTFLLLLCGIRFRWILAAFHSFRRQAFITLAAVYTGMFILVFSAIANLGILARQRVQMLPLFLVLLCVPSRRKRQRDEEKRKRGQGRSRPESEEGSTADPALAGSGSSVRIGVPVMGSEEERHGRGG